MTETTIMEKVKILVIEDMIETIRGSFNLAALSVFNENMSFEFKSRSQDVDYSSINEYSLVFVDIELAKGTKEDGFAVINKLTNDSHYPLERILILTGNTVVEEKLVENKIDPTIVVVKKPVNYVEIANELKKKIKLNKNGTYSLI